MSDIDLQRSVRQAITEIYLKSNKSTDVNYLAAKMIAIELLGEAWKEMGKQSEKTDQKTVDSVGQIGM